MESGHGGGHGSGHGSVTAHANGHGGGDHSAGDDCDCRHAHGSGHADGNGHGAGHGNAVSEKPAKEPDDIGTPLLIFLEFDPEMWLPPNFAWKKQARPLSIGSSQNLTDLARVAEREVSAHCVELGLPEYPHGCHVCTTIAWNAKSEDGLKPKDLVGDSFADGDTLFVYASMFAKDEHGCCGHEHGDAHGHGGGRHTESDDCCGLDHCSGHTDGSGHTADHH